MATACFSANPIGWPILITVFTKRSAQSTCLLTKRLGQRLPILARMQTLSRMGSGAPCTQTGRVLRTTPTARMANRWPRYRAGLPNGRRATARSIRLLQKRRGAGYDRARRQRLALGVTVAVIACSGIAYFVPMGSRPIASLPSATALPESMALLSRAAATPTFAPPDPASFSSVPSLPPPAADIADTPAVVPAAASVTPLADSQLSPLEPTPNQTLLGREEAKEIQARLRSFGFNPGPVDGVPGALTEGAITRYQQNRGLFQTGKVDRELLERLRQDPAPKIVRRAAGPYYRPAPSPPPRSSNPFASIRAAGDRLGQWLDSRLR